MLLVVSIYKVITFTPPALQDDPLRPRPIPWTLLERLDYRQGRIPPRLQRYAGIHVRVPGFMIPLEDTSGEVQEFLLTPTLTGCIHVPPPPPNQVIHVTMEKPVPYTWKPLWVAGKLEIQGAGDHLELRMKGTEASPYLGNALRVED